MSQNLPFMQGTCYKQRFVISACGFTFEGYSLLLKSRGVNATRLHFEEDEVCSGDVQKMSPETRPISGWDKKWRNLAQADGVSHSRGRIRYQQIQWKILFFS
ncbi:hypothetical protein RZN68_14475 [Enterobacter hormaechei]|nr:hypothetical protein [Enterobacter hormaechei]